MTKVVVLLLAIPILKVMLPRRKGRTGKNSPYQSVFDVPVPSELACSELCYAPSETRHQEADDVHADGGRQQLHDDNSPQHGDYSLRAGWLQH